MSFKYEDEKLELEYKGAKHEFRAPSAVEYLEVMEKFNTDKDNKDVVKTYIDFYIELGLPKEVVSKMSMKGLGDLFAYVVASKKN